LNRKFFTKVATITTAVATATILFSGVALAAPGTLVLGPAWGEADRTDANRVEVTYTIKAGRSVPIEAVAAVEAGIDAWNDAIDNLEAGWDFDLVPYVNGGTTSLSGGPPSGSHRPEHNPPGRGGGGGNGDEPDITIQLKKGGGVIAGSAQRTLDNNGYVIKVKLQISGSAFGLQNDAATITEVTMHELGHALGLGHHSNQDDLMGTTVGYEGGGPSACDLAGFVLVHEWLTDGVTSTGPYIIPDASITCP
jgi:hypothetical protein